MFFFFSLFRPFSSSSGRAAQSRGERIIDRLRAPCRPAPSLAEFEAFAQRPQHVLVASAFFSLVLSSPPSTKPCWCTQCCAETFVRASRVCLSWKTICDTTHNWAESLLGFTLFWFFSFRLAEYLSSQNVEATADIASPRRLGCHRRQCCRPKTRYRTFFLLLFFSFFNHG